MVRATRGSLITQASNAWAQVSIPVLARGARSGCRLRSLTYLPFFYGSMVRMPMPKS